MSLLNLLIGLLPLLVLVTLLALNRYPGEKFIETLRGLIDRSRRPAGLARPVRGRLLSFLKPVRGGQLIARSMAGRAPPVST